LIEEQLVNFFLKCLLVWFLNVYIVSICSDFRRYKLL
jgi:hypothetical protein